MPNRRCSQESSLMHRKWAHKRWKNILVGRIVPRTLPVRRFTRRDEDDPIYRVLGKAVPFICLEAFSLLFNAEKTSHVPHSACCRVGLHRSIQR